MPATPRPAPPPIGSGCACRWTRRHRHDPPPGRPCRAPARAALRARHSPARVGRAQPSRLPRGAAQGRKPAARRLLQDPGRAQSHFPPEPHREAPRRHRRLGRQSCPGGRPGGVPGRHAGHHRHAGGLPHHQGRAHPPFRRRGHARARRTGGGDRGRAAPGRGARPDLHPSLRRSAHPGRPGDFGARDPGGGARGHLDRHSGWRRRADRRHGGGDQGEPPRRQGVRSRGAGGGAGGGLAAPWPSGRAAARRDAGRRHPPPRGRRVDAGGHAPPRR